MEWGLDCRAIVEATVRESLAHSAVAPHAVPERRTQSGHSAEPTCRRGARSGNERYERLRQSLRDASLGPASCVPHPATAGARA